ncbi:MAG: response regulator transcription factor [Bacteroidales bacterium]|nr:response regulator transcription factor [Bacteroidales bacterium]
MIKVLIIDDEPLALKQLEHYISKISFFELVASCNSAAAAKDYLEVADAAFVDINMPDVSGMDLVRSLKNPPLIVFTTAYAQYAVEGFQVNALDYLLKPFGFKEFSATAERIKKRLELMRAAETLAHQDDSISFKTDYKTVRVPVSDICYIESMSEYVKIFLYSQDTPLVVLYSLKRLAEQLPANQFARIHRSYIVALWQVREISRNSVTLNNGLTLPIGEIYREDFLKKIKN